MLKIVAKYNFKSWKAAIENSYSKEYYQIISVINSIDSELIINKESRKKYEWQIANLLT